MTRQWETIRTYEDIKYEQYGGIAKITINRPEVRNAFRPKTVSELIDAFSRARDDQSIGVIVLTGEGEKAFCSGGDQSVRGHGGYVGEDEIPRLKRSGLATSNPRYSKTGYCNGCGICNRRRARSSCCL